uniref:IQ domain-containing protein K-like isoform X1 n=1 Tax=Osmia lignaria TaxID=473952 RepID=UPI0014796925|nr:IQ domain-containing protein K-like isoform X1 [Osmia lignaria]
MCSRLSPENRKASVCEGPCPESEISRPTDCEYYGECKRTIDIDQEDDQLPSRYLEQRIFHLLLPAIEETLIEASKWNALRVQKCRFNGLDYIAELLWNRNPRRSKIYSPMLNVFEIPPFKEYLLKHPRPYYPKSWLWSEEEAALHMQRYVRGWLVRKREDVQEMRQFWKDIAGKNIFGEPDQSLGTSGKLFFIPVMLIQLPEDTIAGEKQDPKLIRCEKYRSMFLKYKTRRLKTLSDSKRQYQ